MKWQQSRARIFQRHRLLLNNGRSTSCLTHKHRPTLIKEFPESLPIPNEGFQRPGLESRTLSQNGNQVLIESLGKRSLCIMFLAEHPQQIAIRLHDTRHDLEDVLKNEVLR